MQLACLLHDASESYLSDLTRPVKRNLAEYCLIEGKLQNMIYQKFGLGDLSEEEHRQLREVDDVLLHVEFDALMEPGLFLISLKAVMNHDLSQRNFMSVEKEFLALFHHLIG